MNNKNYKNSLTIITLLGLGVILTGCTGMSGSFGCNAMPGSSCTPVSVINQEVDNGTYQDKTSERESQKHPGVQASLLGFDMNDDANLTGHPIRSTEHTKRIWIAPYIDQQDNYHQSNIVYTVLTKPYWLGTSVSMIQKQG